MRHLPIIFTAFGCDNLEVVFRLIILKSICAIHEMCNVRCSCPDVTPPPYTAIAEGHDTSERKDVPSTDGIEADDTCPVQTVFPRYDVIPADCVAVPEATGVTTEASELPVKAAIR